MSQLIETRWRRYGKDRVYVRTAEGDDVGHVDLVERTVVPRIARYETELKECLLRWTVAVESTLDEQHVVPTSTPATDCTDLPATEHTGTALTTSDNLCRDLAANVAGEAARAKRDEVNAQAPVMNLVARLLGVKTNERAWRVGAKGEEKVASELAKLGPRWHVLHAVEVGDNGSDIDHVVIGPAGVFTLNAKRHPGGKAWVGERMVMVNGQRTDYLRNSRFEAKRASRLLSDACGRPVNVTPVLVFVDLEDVKVMQMPNDVHVTTRRRIAGWLRSLPPVIDDLTAEMAFEKARLSTTWRG